MAKQKWVAETALEMEFEALVKERGAEITELYDKLKALSDETGIPFGNYVPVVFNWGGRFRSLDPEFVNELAGSEIDWLSSTLDC